MFVWRHLLSWRCSRRARHRHLRGHRLLRLRLRCWQYIGTTGKIRTKTTGIRWQAWACTQTDCIYRQQRLEGLEDNYVLNSPIKTKPRYDAIYLNKKTDLTIWVVHSLKKKLSVNWQLIFKVQTDDNGVSVGVLMLFCTEFYKKYHEAM